MIYQYSENFISVYSHDEVVHLKASMLGKMAAGSVAEKAANLRALYGYIWTYPGKKLLFMGSEFAQWGEWSHDGSLEWHLTQYDRHQGVQRWVEDLNRVYRAEPALHECDCDPAGFEWIDCNDYDNGVLAFLRRGHSSGDWIMAVCNFTPVPRESYRIGVPRGGHWQELLNSDAERYGGGNWGNQGGCEAEPTPFHGRPYSINATVPALSAVFFKNVG